MNHFKPPLSRLQLFLYHDEIEESSSSMGEEMGEGGGEENM